MFGRMKSIVSVSIVLLYLTICVPFVLIYSNYTSNIILHVFVFFYFLQV